MKARLLAAALLGLAAACTPGSVENVPEDRGFREPDMQGPFRINLERVIDGWRYNVTFREGARTRRGGRFHLADVHTPSATLTDQPCERDLGVAVRDYVRDYFRGKRLRVRNARPGRDRQVWVGSLEAEGQDVSTKLLEMGLAIPFNESSRNPEMRRWDCANNDAVRQGLERAGVSLPDPTT